MQLSRVQECLKEKEIPFTYTEEDQLGSIDFIHRGLTYHIWEYADAETACGVDTNLLHAGRSEEIEGDYEAVLLDYLTRYF